MSMIKRTAPWSWIVIVVLLGIIAKGPYRSYVQEHALSDFGLANVMPNFFTIMLFVFLASRWWTHPALFIGLLGGCLGSELAQLGVAGRTFDSLDMVAGAVAWLVAIALLRTGQTATCPAQTDAAGQSIPTDRAKPRSG